MSNAEQAAFRVGNFRAPLTASTANALLQDADPAIYTMLAFYKTMLEIHLGARFAAEAAAAGLVLPQGTAPAVVGMAVPYDPVPYLQEAQYVFPVLALFAVEERAEEHTRHRFNTMASWRLVYALPPLTPSQLLKLVPILRAVHKVLLDRTEVGYDPAYLSGAVVAQLAGLEEYAIITTRYGTIRTLDSRTHYPALDMEIRAVEGNEQTDAPGVIQPLESFAADVAVKDENGQEIVAQVEEDLTL